MPPIHSTGAHRHGKALLPALPSSAKAFWVVITSALRPSAGAGNAQTYICIQRIAGNKCQAGQHCESRTGRLRIRPLHKDIEGFAIGIGIRGSGKGADIRKTADPSQRRNFDRRILQENETRPGVVPGFRRTRRVRLDRQFGQKLDLVVPRTERTHGNSISLPLNCSLRCSGTDSS
jgi:hypothetical protein